MIRLFILIMDDGQTVRMDDDQTILIATHTLMIRFLEKYLEYAHQKKHLEDIFH